MIHVMMINHDKCRCLFIFEDDSPFDNCQYWSSGGWFPMGLRGFFPSTVTV
jgi:hypothetical protein